MKQEDLILLKKYLDGNTSAAENRAVQDILTQHEHDEELKRWLFDAWQKTSAKKELSLDINEGWLEIKKTISNNTKSRKIVHWPQVGVAASIVLAITLGVLFFWQKPASDPEDPVVEQAVFIEKETGKGEKLNISLPDGSFIKLNTSTKLSIPANYYSNNERVVYLEGEAFFEVAKFEKKPFKVITGNITTTVMGTSFNVKALSENEPVSVALVEGKVSVANAKDEIILDPAEMTTVRPSTGKLSKETFDVEVITGWRSNLLIFDEILFEEIIEKLEQWYGVEFKIKGAPVGGKRYSGRFENKPLALVLEGLGFSSTFSYEIKDKTIFLNFKK
ncbi:FecR domain-containing protein [Fulvivirgaceae bacterium BMA12]|uniref:FecR domain-containing protein n=1 Tax=Agaribacillus aureus TaxID=3051825 RepID=A0ABT8KZM7_9BACT|nr:FecR domain-containing protein [Fulvivirgaceae bacterium BMA12]